MMGPLYSGHARVQQIAKEKNMDVGELETSVVEELDTIEEMCVTVGIMMSVTDTIIQVFNIVLVTIIFSVFS